MEPNLGVDARFRSIDDLNRGQPSADHLPDHPFMYPLSPHVDREKKHPAGFSASLGNLGPIEWFEKLPSKFDSRHRFVPPPVTKSETPVLVPRLGAAPGSQRAPGSTHSLRVVETRDGVVFGGKRTFPDRIFAEKKF